MHSTAQHSCQLCELWHSTAEEGIREDRYSPIIKLHLI